MIDANNAEPAIRKALAINLHYHGAFYPGSLGNSLILLIVKYNIRF